MSIEKLDQVKLTHEKKPYTQILTEVIQNIKDPLAGFIWVYLSSLPPDWIVIKEQIKNKYNLGDNTLKLIFSYLNRANLIKYTRERNTCGKLGIVSIHVLCGIHFKSDESYIKTTSSKTEPVDKTTGSKTRRVENQTSGSGALQRKYKNKAFKNTNKTKKLLDKNQKSENERRHDFADSMDQMANERRHVEEHQKFKHQEIYGGMPEALRSLVDKMKVR